MSSSAAERIITSKDENCEDLVIGYVTDIEGNINFWNNYVRISKILVVTSSGNDDEPRSIDLRPNTMLVFGGDVCDRLYGDLRVVSELLKLKEKYPDRVVFLFGNRDINKLRLVPELLVPEDYHPDANRCDFGVYWIKQDFPNALITGKVTAAEAGSGAADRMQPVQHQGWDEYRTMKLQWILKQTMGAPIAFESRRVELRELGLPHGDADVTRSFIDSLLPGSLDVALETPAAGAQSVYRSGGWTEQRPKKLHFPVLGLFQRFLSACQLCFLHRDVLVVHGAVSSFNLGWVPPFAGNGHQELFCWPVEGQRDESESPLRRWSRELNRFAEMEMQQYNENVRAYVSSSCSRLEEALKEAARGGGDPWENKPELNTYFTTKGGYDHKQPGSALMQYGMGWMADKSLNRSIVYSNFLSNYRPASLPAEFCESLRGMSAAETMQSVGVRLVITGHQPHGDCPLLIQYDSGTDEYGHVITADSSYSKDTGWEYSEKATEELSRLPEGDAVYPPQPAPAVSGVVPDGVVDTRTVAVSEIFFITKTASDGPEPVSSVCAHGVLSDGRSYATVLPRQSVSQCIGQALGSESDWWVKLPMVCYGNQQAVVEVDECSGEVKYNFYLLVRSQGYSVVNRIITAAEFQESREQ